MEGYFMFQYLAIFKSFKHNYCVSGLVGLCLVDLIKLRFGKPEN